MIVRLWVFAYDSNWLYRFEEKDDSSDDLQTWRRRHQSNSG